VRKCERTACIILSDQQPSTTTLPQRVQPVACRGLGELVYSARHVVEHERLQIVAFLQLRSQRGDFDAPCVTFYLDDSLKCRRLHPQQAVYARHAVNTDGPDFDRAAVTHGLDQRDEARDQGNTSTLEGDATRGCCTVFGSNRG